MKHDEDVAQLVECRTSSLLTCSSLVRQGIFLPELTFSADSGVCTPLCAVACINICFHVKDLVVHESSLDYGNTETPSMHHRLGSTTVAAGFPWEKRPKLLMGEIPVGRCSCERKSFVTSEEKSGRKFKVTDCLPH